MGCGGSKQQPESQSSGRPVAASRAGQPPPSRARNPRPPSQSTHRPPSRSTHRPPSQSTHRPPGSRHSESAKGSSSTGTSKGRSDVGSRRRSTASQAGSSSSRSGRRSQAGPQTRDRHRSRPHTILEEPEDAEIHQEVSKLATLINQHSLEFYLLSSAAAACRTIGTRIVQELQDAGEDEFNAENVASELLSALEDDAIGRPEERQAHMFFISMTARNIHSMWHRHRSEWKFGRWDEGVRFPSLLKNGREVLAAEYQF